ncbi:MAG TPA: hypothetical protein VHZ76_04280 [Gammaproteobacteria bacterium]|nr:hypothetical protein [Gammaproteobacteria bacterium]
MLDHGEDLMRKNCEAYIEKRLEEWAVWFLKCSCVENGYPKSSSFNLFQIGLGINVIGEHLPASLPVNEEAEEVEQSIRQLASYNKLLAQILRLHYLEPRLSKLKKATALGLSHTTYRISLEMSKMWVGGHLSSCFKK